MLENKITDYLKRNNFTEFTLKAVLFDMDGVLFDSMKLHAEAWVKAMNEVKLPFTSHEAYMNEGRTGTATINSVFVDIHGREAAEDEKQAIYALKSKYFDGLGEVKTMPYAPELLQKLKAQGLKIIVVTGSAQPTLLDNLTVHFPDVFTKDDVISAFDVTHGKPHPEPYLKGLEKAGVQPWQALVVENAPMGALAASSAKIFTIGVNTGPLNEEVLTENGADIVLSGMQELYEKWDELFK